jgi:hypothetical protein
MKHTKTLVLFALFALGCSDRTNLPDQRSPDGTMMLSTSIHRTDEDPKRYLCVVVDITDSSGMTLHHEVTPVSSLHQWSIAWEGNSEVVMETSDIGYYRMRRLSNDTWKGTLIVIE